MLRFKLISVIDGFYHYEIYPEGVEEDKGWIIFNPIRLEVKEKVRPNSPFDCFALFFANLKDENGEFKKEGMAAWY